MVELDFEKLFKLQMDGMKICQCHIKTNFRKHWLWRSIFMGHYLFGFCVVSNCIKYYLNRKDYFKAFKNGVPFIHQICMLFNYSVLLKNRQLLDRLITCVKDDYAKSNAYETKFRNIMEKCALEGKKVMVFWCIMTAGTVGMFVQKCLFLNIYHYKSGEKIRLYPFYEMHYPLNLTERREHNLFIFAATFYNELYYTSVSLLILFVSFPLGIIFMLHARGQLEIVKMKFENIFENEDVEERLNEIVENLQYIYRFVDETNNCFTMIYEIMLKENILLLPVTSYAMIQSISAGEVAVEFIGVLIENLIISSIPCYYGDLIMQKGEEVRLAAYNCGWERVFKPKARKTLLIIMARAVKPVAIRSIFCVICLDTLTNVYRQSYTIFNLMTAMW